MPGTAIHRRIRVRRQGHSEPGPCGPRRPHPPARRRTRDRRTARRRTRTVGPARFAVAPTPTAPSLTARGSGSAATASSWPPRSSPPSHDLSQPVKRSRPSGCEADRQPAYRPRMPLARPTAPAAAQRLNGSTAQLRAPPPIRSSRADARWRWPVGPIGPKMVGVTTAEEQRQSTNLSECWCCGGELAEPDLLRLGSHPEAGVCPDSARDLQRRATARRDQQRRTWSARLRAGVRATRARIIEHGWHNRPVLGRLLRHIDRHLP
jgi:hypothetical protein